MNLYTKLKGSIILFLLVLLTSCSSDDDQTFNLLLGDWILAGKCEERNILTFNPNGSYIWLESQNEDCEDNEFPTSKTTGFFSVSGYSLTLNRDNFEIIDPGEHFPDIQLQQYISSRIITLTEDSLKIEITYMNNNPSLPGVKVNFTFYR